MLRWQLIVTRPEIAKLMALNPDILTKSSSEKALENTIIAQLFKVNIVNANGEVWKRHRKIVNPAFRKQFTLQTFNPIASKLTDAWGNGGVYNVSDWMQRMTLDALGHAIFNTDFNTIQNSNSEFVTAYNHIIKKAIDVKWIYFYRFDRRWNPLRREAWQSFDKFMDYLKSLLEKKRSELHQMYEKGIDIESERKNLDLLTLMLYANENDDDEKGQSRLSDEELLANCFIFFIAGHETSATSLSTCIYYLARHPEIQEKARQEALKALESSLDFSNGSDFPYINACIDEALRIVPPVRRIPARIVSKEIELLGHPIPVGTRVTLDVYGIHHSERYWKNPESFVPERHLEKKSTENPYTFFPFGGGSRICLGMQFSLVEQRVVLAKILQKYTWKLPENSIHKDDLIFSSTGLVSFKDLDIEFAQRPVENL